MVPSFSRVAHARPVLPLLHGHHFAVGERGAGRGGRGRCGGGGGPPALLRGPCWGVHELLPSMRLGLVRMCVRLCPLCKLVRRCPLYTLSELVLSRAVCSAARRAAMHCAWPGLRSVPIRFSRHFLGRPPPKRGAPFHCPGISRGEPPPLGIPILPGFPPSRIPPGFPPGFFRIPQLPQIGDSDFLPKRGSPFDFPGISRGDPPQNGDPHLIFPAFPGSTPPQTGIPI